MRMQTGRPQRIEIASKKGKRSAKTPELATVTETQHQAREQALKDLPLFERHDFENLLQPDHKSKTERTAETKSAQMSMPSSSNPHRLAAPAVTASSLGPPSRAAWN
ncbi:MAG: hypothetical protein U0798_16910 [Gemmataceae bacterium]